MDRAKIMQRHSAAPPVNELSKLISQEVQTIRKGLMLKFQGDIPSTENTTKKRNLVTKICRAASQRLIRLRALCSFMDDPQKGGKIPNLLKALQTFENGRSYPDNAQKKLLEGWKEPSQPYDIHTAVDVMSSGDYTSLPTYPLHEITALRSSVEDGLSLPTEETITRLNQEIRYLLSKSNMKQIFTRVEIVGGRAVLTKKDVFRLEITCIFRRWRLLHADILFGQPRGQNSQHAQPDFTLLMDAIGAIIWESRETSQGRSQVIPLSKALGSLYNEEESMKQRGYSTPIRQVKHWMVSRKIQKHADLLKRLRKRFPSWNIDETVVVEIINILQLHFDVQNSIHHFDVQVDEMLRSVYTTAYNFCCRLALRSLKRQARMLGAQFCTISSLQSTVDDHIILEIFKESGTPVHVRVDYKPIDFSDAGSDHGRNHELSACLLVNEQISKKINIAIETGRPDCRALINTAKRFASGNILSMEYEKLLGNLPWFLTPGDIGFNSAKIQNENVATDISILLNGVIQLIVQVDLRTGLFEFTVAACLSQSFAKVDHAPINDMIDVCKRIVKRSHKSKTPLETQVSQMQAAIITIELKHAIKSSTFKHEVDLIDPSLTRAATLVPGKRDNASVWVSEYTTLLRLKDHDGWFLAMCVASNSYSANRAHSVSARYRATGGTRFLWPPICEIVLALPGFSKGVSFSSASILHQHSELGPFRETISIDLGSVQLLGQKRKRSDGTLGLPCITQMWTSDFTGDVDVSKCVGTVSWIVDKAKEAIHSASSKTASDEAVL